MKNLTTILLATALCASTATAVKAESARLTPDDYLNLLRIDLRASKARIVGDAMELTKDEANVFWPIYREYDAALSKLNVDRINLLREYAERYAEIDDARAARFTRESFDYMRERLDLLQKYSRKLSKAMSPTIAARFAQIESHLQMLIDVQLASEFPLVPRQSALATAGSW